MLRVLLGSLLLGGCAFFRPIVPPGPDVLATGSGCHQGESGPRDFVGHVVSSGYPRTFRVHVPPGYRSDRPMPVVMSFHGYVSSGASHERETRLSPFADREGFIVVYPNALDAWSMQRFSTVPWLRSWNAGSCCGDAQGYQLDDVAFVRALLAQLESQLCVDQRRVYAAGMSNGGMLAHRLACELSDRIAAVAAVSSVNVLHDCHPSRPVPVLQMNGTEDHIVPYDGSAWFSSAQASVDGWALRNDCDPAALITTFEHGDTTCVAHTGCVPVEQCTIRGGGHAWPGGSAPPPLGKASRDFSANEQLWRFFQANPLPAPGADPRPAPP